jgi:hypothetical protein
LALSVDALLAFIASSAALIDALAGLLIECFAVRTGGHARAVAAHSTLATAGYRANAVFTRLARTALHPAGAAVVRVVVEIGAVTAARLLSISALTIPELTLTTTCAHHAAATAVAAVGLGVNADFVAAGGIAATAVFAAFPLPDLVGGVARKLARRALLVLEAMPVAEHGTVA